MTGTGRRSAAAALRRLVSLWRRSLQTRVVVTTLVVSALVVAVLGVFLLGRVADGLVQTQRRAALAEAGAGFIYAENQISQSDQTKPAALDQLLETITITLDSRAHSSYVVGLLATDNSSYSFGDVGFHASQIPQELRTTVVGQDAEAYAYTRTSAGDSLVVGTPLAVATGPHELYYVFPLTDQQATLALVRRTMAVGGLALVALLAAVAALVTRQVVTPVRLAAQVAARLASGQLEERMSVRGEDDLAKLASTFNLMARNLQRQIGQLEELSRVQRRFTADVSHELRTPLTTVRMAADVLHDARADFPPETARAAELLQGELNRFESLLVDLLEISRFDARAAVLEAEPVDLAGLVRTEVVAIEALAARRGVSIDTHGIPRRPLIAEVDARRVSRILRNLLSNAIEHSEGRPVEVSMGTNGSAAAIVVRDHGVGFAPGQAALVFTRFWRADPSRARHTGGTGLGLSIALEDARLHGGWLQAWGAPGRGASFRLTLPLRAGGELKGSPLPLEPEKTVSLGRGA